ncbi:MAG: hypothetical protein FWF02_01255 [Micrococcales bacterium]|nr:hypothetical protein [Micrococcales bacterium]MCL2666321.1 hypothetical protein [Micrococcales bacterium]
MSGQCWSKRRQWTCVTVVALVVGLAGCVGSARPAQGAEQAARAFLHAIASGRTDDAVDLLRVQPLDRTLVTDDVLVDALRDLAISQVTARARGGEDTRMVDVAYRVGDQRVTDTYQMVRIGTSWFVDETLPLVPYFDDRPAYATATVGGKEVVLANPHSYPPEPGTPVLFGRYQFALDHPMFEVDRAEFTVTSLHAPVRLTGAGPQARLTADARTQVAAASKEKLDGCVTLTTLQTPCMGHSMGEILVRDSHGKRWYTLVDNTSTWSLDRGGTDLATTVPDWQTCTDQFSRSERAICAYGLAIFVHMNARTTAGATEVNVDQVIGYSADLRDPDNIRIVFHFS